MINVIVEWGDQSRSLSTNATESDFWQAVGRCLLEVGDSVPTTMNVQSDCGNALFDIKKRGAWVENGVEHPSIYVTEIWNYVSGLAPSVYEKAYLTCVHPESNNYKYYELLPSANGIDAEYGRIGSDSWDQYGARRLQDPYPTYMYWIRYYEKLSKGYIDNSQLRYGEAIVSTQTNRNTKAVNVDKGVARVLYDQLFHYAKSVVRETLVSDKITSQQVKEAKRLLSNMRKRKTVKGFNNNLRKLLMISPRKATFISAFFADSVDSFGSIIEREEDLIAAMEVVALRDSQSSSGKKAKVGFSSMGIEVYEATDKQASEVLKHLGDGLKARVRKIYRVVDKKKKARFDSYLHEKGITNVKQLWHGSRNANWLSIMSNGLVLNPNAVITGKMFGQGIYFAPSAQKSWGYTSSQSAYWNAESSDVAFMGLYAVAYGEPYNVTSALPYNYSEADLPSGKNCVHAHGGPVLRNDEIIFYNEAAMVMNYIVEFAA